MNQSLNNTHPRCYIFGSGRSILDLTPEEKDYLNAHPNTLSMNKYLAFHEKVGVVPAAHFIADHHYPAHWCVAESIRRARHLVPKPRLLLHNYYRRLFQWNLRSAWRVRSLLWGLSTRWSLWKTHRFWFPLFTPRTSITWFHSQEDSRKPFCWAETLNDQLYFYRGSLTTAINLCNIIWPGRDVCLLGVDLNTRRAFYQEDIDAMPELFATMKQSAQERAALSLEQGVHATALTYRGVPGVQAVIPMIVKELERRNVRLLCCNPKSLLVTDGLCEYAPVIPEV